MRGTGLAGYRKVCSCTDSRAGETRLASLHRPFTLSCREEPEARECPINQRSRTAFLALAWREDQWRPRPPPPGRFVLLKPDGSAVRRLAHALDEDLDGRGHRAVHRSD